MVQFHLGLTAVVHRFCDSFDVLFDSYVMIVQTFYMVKLLWFPIMVVRHLFWLFSCVGTISQFDKKRIFLPIRISCHGEGRWSILNCFKIVKIKQNLDIRVKSWPINANYYLQLFSIVRSNLNPFHNLNRLGSLPPNRIWYFIQDRDTKSIVLNEHSWQIKHLTILGSKTFHDTLRPGSQNVNVELKGDELIRIFLTSYYSIVKKLQKVSK